MKTNLIFKTMLAGLMMGCIVLPVNADDGKKKEILNSLSDILLEIKNYSNAVVDLSEQLKNGDPYVIIFRDIVEELSSIESYFIKRDFKKELIDLMAEGNKVGWPGEFTCNTSNDSLPEVVAHAKECFWHYSCRGGRSCSTSSDCCSDAPYCGEGPLNFVCMTTGKQVRCETSSDCPDPNYPYCNVVLSGGGKWCGATGENMPCNGSSDCTDPNYPYCDNNLWLCTENTDSIRCRGDEECPVFMPYCNQQSAICQSSPSLRFCYDEKPCPDGYSCLCDGSLFMQGCACLNGSEDVFCYTDEERELVAEDGKHFYCKDGMILKDEDPIGSSGGVSDFRWLDIAGCDCDQTKGISTDPSDELCNAQCCRDKYGSAGFAVKAVCCSENDDDCICKANGCKRGDDASVLDSFCCAKKDGLI